MNYLQLAQRLRRRCRVPGSGPSAVTNQNEESNRLLDFINEAWVAIQEMHPDWFWMRASMSFPVVDGQATYTLAQIESTGTGFTNFGAWAQDSFRCYLTASGTVDEQELSWVPYEYWRDEYQFGASRTATSRPHVVTQLPALGLGLGQVPAAGYTISGDYFKKATELSASTDEPGLPSQYHMLIVYRAMMLFAGSEAAGEIFQMGKALGDEMIKRLELQQLPEVTVGGALA